METSFNCRTWAARRKHTKQRKQRQAFMSCHLTTSTNNSSSKSEDQKNEDDPSKPTQETELGRPTLPKGTKLITFPIAPNHQSSGSLGTDGGTRTTNEQGATAPGSR